MINDIYNSVCDVVNIIWEHLHFSVSEKRPLTSVNEWMSDFMKNLADGINKNKKLITKAISGVADVMSLDMDSQLGISMTASVKEKNPYGTVVNNYNNMDNATRSQHKKRIKELQKFIKTQPTTVSKFDEALAKKLLAKIIIHEDYLEFMFKSGVTVSIEK